jgi:hypothetical protein
VLPEFQLVLHHLQPAMDLAAQSGPTSVAGEDRAHSPADFFHQGVGSGAFSARPRQGGGASRVRQRPPTVLVRGLSWMVGDTGIEPVTSSVSRQSRARLTGSITRSTGASPSADVHRRLYRCIAIVTHFVTHLPRAQPSAPAAPAPLCHCRAYVSLLRSRLASGIRMISRRAVKMRVINGPSQGR